MMQLTEGHAAHRWTLCSASFHVFGHYYNGRPKTMLSGSAVIQRQRCEIRSDPIELWENTWIPFCNRLW